MTLARNKKGKVTFSDFFFLGKFSCKNMVTFGNFGQKFRSEMALFPPLSPKGPITLIARLIILIQEIHLARWDFGRNEIMKILIFSLMLGD